MVLVRRPCFVFGEAFDQPSGSYGCQRRAADAAAFVLDTLGSE